MVPETIEVSAEGFNPSRIQLVEPSVPGWPIDDEFCALQNPQML